MESVKKLEGLLKDQPQNPMRHAQLQDHHEELERLESIVKAPAWQAGADRGHALKSYKQIKKKLDDQAPKPIEDSGRRDQVAKLSNEILNDLIIPSMLPRSHMRRNPAGSV